MTTTNPTLLAMPIAKNGTKNTIPETQAAAGNGLMSQSTGFPPETALPLGAGGKAPTREDFNGAFNLLSNIAFFAQKGWTFQYDATQDYFKGCLVIDPSDGLRYECIADMAAGTVAPHDDITNTYWKIFKSGLDREQIPAVNHRDVITTSGTYTASVDGWYKITVKGAGGGGGGAYYGSNGHCGGGGGGEGGTTIAYEYMSAGTTASIVIGGGGTGGAYGGYAGNNGGDSSVAVNNNTYMGGGGKGGDGANGAGGQGAGGTGTIHGAAGGGIIPSYAGVTYAYASQGGGAGGGGYGNNATAGTAAAVNSGGGGCGGNSTTGGNTGAGFDGADGFAWFEYFAAI